VANYEGIEGGTEGGIKKITEEEKEEMRTGRMQIQK
jgi:hypothetical protein